MKRVETNGDWPLMCPNECPGLSEVYGDEFEELFEKYEREGKFRKVVSAQKVWYAILESQTETGGPFMCYKVRSCSLSLSLDHSLMKKKLTTLSRAYLRIPPTERATRRTWG